MDDDTITLTTIASEPLSAVAREALSIAASEIVADFTDGFIEEVIIVSRDRLPYENLLSEGWVYQRLESS